MQKDSQSYAKMEVQSNPSCWEGIFGALSSCFTKKVGSIQIEGQVYDLVKLIAEGGFSFVYLATSPQGPKDYFAIKKMIVQTEEQLLASQWEIEVIESLMASAPQKESQDEAVHKKKKTKKAKSSKEEMPVALLSEAVEIEEKKEEKKEANNDKDDNDNGNDITNNDSKYCGYEYILPLLNHTMTRHEKIPEFKIVYMDSILRARKSRQRFARHAEEWNFLHARN
ncbi:hypothetical protein RFI_09394 [Reticulomyxa filosa]|uniref:non-specific serine/threonine protein kinase n=1 Tax=Reticulomyxa filosa TaxID=46433 RepID=X6NN82_RETFI|nr:hypothetical protein RFI_09394 [Reticulomyxa filosa]|eukprot:ETO27740.1 hypothetical protein RFI_09394 [Reticulomyxa filosa]